MSQKVLVYLIGLVIGCLLMLWLFPAETFQPKPRPNEELIAPYGYYPVTVIDDYAREVTIERQPRFIVSLAPSTTELLYALELGTRVKAVSDYTEYPAEAVELAAQGNSIGNLAQPNIEKALSYLPDIVIGTTFTPRTAYAQMHQPPRTLALALSHESVEDVLSDVALLAKALGVPAQGIALRERLRGEMAAVDTALEAIREQPARKTVVLYGFDASLQPGTAPGQGTWVGDLLAGVHAENIAATSGSSWGELSLEGLAAAAPEVILFPDGRTPEAQAALRKNIGQLPTDPVWQHIPAVQHGRLEIIDQGPLSIPGPRMGQAKAILARAVWPEAFASDPAE